MDLLSQLMKDSKNNKKIEPIKSDPIFYRHDHDHTIFYLLIGYTDTGKRKLLYSYGKTPKQTFCTHLDISIVEDSKVPEKIKTKFLNEVKKRKINLENL